MKTLALCALIALSSVAQAKPKAKHPRSVMLPANTQVVCIVGDDEWDIICKPFADVAAFLRTGNNHKLKSVDGEVQDAPMQTIKHGVEK